MSWKLVALACALLMVSTMTFAGNIGSAASIAGINGNASAGHNSAATGMALLPVNLKTVFFNLPMDYRTIALDPNLDGLFFRYSYVTRGRAQVFRNDNRNTILKFIGGMPGSTLYDISKALGMNIGTARYHLMILSLNHLVATYNDGPRRIRYFTNNGQYSENSMKAISLLNREPTRKLLGALASSGCLTNSGIAAASDLSYSDVNRYLKELMAKGAVTKELSGKGKYSYRIAPEIEGYIKSEERN